MQLNNPLKSKKCRKAIRKAAVSHSLLEFSCNVDKRI